MIDVRCKKCNRLLMKSNGKKSEGLIFEIKCSKCGFIGSYSMGSFEVLGGKDTVIGKTKSDITVLNIH